MFFVDNDKSEFLEGQEHSTSGSQDYIIRMRRKLLLPYLHALGIAILGVIDAQSVAKHLMKTFHDLHGEGDFRQEIKHLLMFLYRLSDEMDVDFGLSARSHAMKKHHVFLHHLHQYLVVGIFLRNGERLDHLKMRLARRIESAHL